MICWRCLRLVKSVFKEIKSWSSCCFTRIIKIKNDYQKKYIKNSKLVMTDAAKISVKVIFYTWWYACTLWKTGIPFISKNPNLTCLEQRHRFIRSLDGALGKRSANRSDQINGPLWVAFWHDTQAVWLITRILFLIPRY